ncbi:MAG: beta-N-acetylhexosaminidase [Pseudomonadota bacterium]|nr:beta-N-acetylhexosaminidase [Pseudomonadota bacterium]
MYNHHVSTLPACSDHNPADASRRNFLKGSAQLGAALLLPGLLTGCNSDDDQDDWWNWPLERKISQMLLVGFRGTVLTDDNPIVRDIRDYQIGGVILFDRDVALKQDGRNITSPTQLQALTASLKNLARTPLFIAVDQEGGNVARLKERYGFPPTVTAQSLGTADDLALTAQAADRIANTLVENGLNLNFAPVVDLNVNPDSPAIGKYQRSFSADPAIVTRHAGEFVNRQRQRGVMSALKHFPGHGSATADSHQGFVDVTETLSRRRESLSLSSMTPPKTRETQPAHSSIES